MRVILGALIVTSFVACGEDAADSPKGSGGSAGSGTDASTCWPGAVVCGATCAHLDTDPAHCGACGNACAAGELCSLGTCGADCAAGTTNCSGACANLLTDPAHCGACNQPCAADELCAGGNCVSECPGALVACSGGCFDLSSNPSHCGACGAKCALGGCASGKCHCGDGAQNGDETDLDCGGSCSACSHGQACSQPGDCASGLACAGKICQPTLSLEADLVGYWPLNGDAQDFSGNGNHGVVHGATLAPGKIGQGYSITSGCISVPDSASLDMVGKSGFTLLAWVQNAGGCASDRGIVLNKEETYEIGIECATNLLQEAIQLSDGLWSWAGTGAVSVGSWQHVAVTWDGATVRHYVDGAEVYTRALAGAFADRATGLGIGCRSVPADASAAGGSFFLGVIDEVAVYSRGLSAAEVQAHHQAAQ